MPDYVVIGPARVYTLRRQYRQFILRVSADNVDVITSANLQVSKDRTLDMFVEPVCSFLLSKMVLLTEASIFFRTATTERSDTATSTVYS